MTGTSDCTVSSRQWMPRNRPREYSLLRWGTTPWRWSVCYMCSVCGCRFNWVTAV